ncbi:MAG TPA: Ig domain-containing protein [Terriglobales bacterium]|nr:Ig domain-containing protein [Terriglobales bacterium]
MRVLGIAAWLLLSLLSYGVSAQTSTQRPLQITTAKLPVPAARQKYEVQLQAAGGLPPYRWSLAPSSKPLPPGLTLQESTGLIYGRPVSSSEYSIIVQVQDSSEPPVTVVKQLVTATAAPLTIQWTTKPHLDGSNLSGALRVSNGTKDTVQLTVIVVAVNEIGKAFALRYEHLTLPTKSETPDLAFTSSLPLGSYVVHADAIGEVPAKNVIYRDHRELEGIIVTSQ